MNHITALQLLRAAIVLSSGLIPVLQGQVTLTPGVPEPIYIVSGNGSLFNGKNGFVLPISGDPVRITVDIQLTPVNSGLNAFLRCGADATGSAYDAMAGTGNDGAIHLSLTRPTVGAAQNCYVALQQTQAPTSGAGIAGRLTASLQPLSSGTQVTVSSLASIFLAGQPPNTRFGNLSAPVNSPPSVPISLTAGQGLNIFAAGQISGSAPEGAGFTSVPASSGGAAGAPAATNTLGLADAYVERNSLVGVFLGDNVDTAHVPPGIDYAGGLSSVQTVYPALQQVFEVGNGTTIYGKPRVFVVPAGATRLFLASSSGSLSATGSFVVNVSTADIPPRPPVPATGAPVSISALQNIYLIDQPTGANLLSTRTAVSNLVAAVAPYSTPTQIPIALAAGQTLHIRTLDNGGLAAAGLLGVEGASPTSGAFGISGISLAGGLVGVFVGDTIDVTKTPASPNYGNLATIPVTQKPLLQQLFYAGGFTSPQGVNPPDVVVPAGATRLFIAATAGGTGNWGAIPVEVTPDNPNAPQIGSGGIVTNAGFAKVPVAPGSMVAIFGTNFGPVSYPSSVPLPTNLGGTQVFFNEIAAPLFYVSPTQIVAQVPFELPFPIVDANGEALVTVVNNGVPGSHRPSRLRLLGWGFLRPQREIR